MTFLTPEQLAGRWGVSVRHAERMAQTRQIAALRVGRLWRFSLTAVEAYEAARSNRPADPPSPEARNQEPIRPVFGVLEETGAPLPLPERWWETDDAASPAAGRGRSTGKEKRLRSALRSR